MPQSLIICYNNLTEILPPLYRPQSFWHVAAHLADLVDLYITMVTSSLVARQQASLFHVPNGFVY